MWLVQHNGLHAAPLPPNLEKHRVVDIGCGTGVWAIAYATEHPNSEVLGIDITMPRPKSTPANCHFAVADAEGDWSFAAADEPFDLIYGRMLINSIRDWPGFMKRCLEYLRPGGWLQLDDVAHRFFSEDGCGEADAPMVRWWRLLFQESSRNNGIDIDGTYKHAQEMRDEGFVDVRERVFKWPVGSARATTVLDRTIGDMLYRNLQVLIGGVTETAVQNNDLHRMSAEQAYALAEQAKCDVAQNSDRHGYYMHFATYVGQAPCKDS